VLAQAESHPQGFQPDNEVVESLMTALDVSESGYPESRRHGFAAPA